jgi:hypothetical protein
MQRRSVRRTLSHLAVLALVSCGGGRPHVDTARFVRETTRDRLERFANDDELRSYLAGLTEIRRRQVEAQSATASGAVQVEAEAPSEAGSAEDFDEEAITNVQVAGVDEGGIVKTHGDHLVVLRRGRLFTIALGQGALQPIDALDAYPPGGRAADWYDEMLVHGDTIVVVGFSYQVSATELGLFHVDAAGRLAHHATYWLRSNDYYSSRNYASRLVGDRLVFYMPYGLQAQGGGDPLESLPGLRRATNDSWERIVTSSAVYRPIQPTTYPVLHTVVTCELASSPLRCDARGVIGPYGRHFYVSGDAVFVWIDDEGSWDQGHGEIDPTRPGSVVYRLPLAGGDPGAMRAWGSPTDQFSFHQSDEGFLDVLVRSAGGGDGMWGPEVSAGDVALARMPLAAFTPSVPSLRPEAYTALPRPRAGYEFQNRFVGDHVLYGTGNTWGDSGEDQDRTVYVHPWRRGGPTTPIALDHGVDRIEVMGRGAVVIGGTGSALVFSSIDLAAPVPARADAWTMPGATQGETRSHGFFYRPLSADDGMLGLPVRGASMPGWSQLVEGSAGVVYLRASRLRLSPLGSLAANGAAQVDDACVASCVDWYGNARPIFWRDRVFALLGYELVEGRVQSDRMVEVARTSFAPRGGLALRR